MKIVVTGGAGFIGSHLIDRLIVLGHQAISIDRCDEADAPSYINPQCQYFWGHTSVVLPFPVDIVYHLASYVSPGESMNDQARYIVNNEIDTAHLFIDLSNYPVDLRPKRVILASSVTVYGDGYDIKETAPIRPFSVYAITKFAQERLAECYLHQAGIPIVIFRLPIVYGPRQKTTGVVANFLSKYEQGLAPQIYGTGQQLRDFLYVDDAVDGLVAGMDPLVDMIDFNLGSGMPTSLKVMALKMESKLIIGGRDRIIPTALVTQTYRKFDAQCLYPNIDKAKDILGFCPKFNIDKGLDKYIAHETNQEEKT